jgi:hypothetical protein
MREIRFSQTHRTTGERRRFVISQFVDTAPAPKTKRAAKSRDLDPAGQIGWHYVAQTQHGAPWTDFRHLDVAVNAPDDVVRKNASRDLSAHPSNRPLH